jgi:hypothetical protein
VCDCLSTVARPRQYRRSIEPIRPLRHFNLYFLICYHLTCLHRQDGVAIYAACASAVGVVANWRCICIRARAAMWTLVILTTTTSSRSQQSIALTNPHFRLHISSGAVAFCNRAASCTTPQDDAPTCWGQLFSAEPCRRGGVRQVGRARAGHDAHARHRRATKPARRHQRICRPSGVGVWWCARHQRNMRARSG